MGNFQTFFAGKEDYVTVIQSKQWYMLGHTMHLQGVRASQKEAVPVNTEDGSTIERLHAYDMILYHVDAPAEEWSLLTIRAELGTETTYFLCPKTEDFTTRVQNGCLSNQQGTFYVHVLNEMGATLCVETAIQNGYADHTQERTTTMKSWLGMQRCSCGSSFQCLQRSAENTNWEGELKL